METIWKPPAVPPDELGRKESGSDNDMEELNRLSIEAAQNSTLTVDELLTERPKIGEQLFIEKYGEEYARKIKRLIEEAHQET